MRKRLCFVVLAQCGKACQIHQDPDGIVRVHIGITGDFCIFQALCGKHSGGILGQDAVEQDHVCDLHIAAAVDITQIRITDRGVIGVIAGILVARAAAQCAVDDTAAYGGHIYGAVGVHITYQEVAVAGTAVEVIGIDAYPALAAVIGTVNTFGIILGGHTVHIQGVDIAGLFRCAVANGLAVEYAVQLFNGNAAVACNAGVTPDQWLADNTAERWETGVVTGAVNTYEMRAWAKKQLAVDPALFIAGIA